MDGIATRTRFSTTMPTTDLSTTLFHGMHCPSSPLPLPSPASTPRRAHDFPNQEATDILSLPAQPTSMSSSPYSLFLLLVKGIMFVTHVFLPVISVFLHSALIALYAISIRNQTAPDMTDPRKPQPGAPWYITKSCGAPVSPSLKGYCMQAKGAFAVTVILL